MYTRWPGIIEASAFDWPHLNPLTPTFRHVGTAIKHPVPYRVEVSFVIFDIWALLCLAMGRQRVKRCMDQVACVLASINGIVL